VSNKSIPAPSRIDRARERLERAVAAVETAAESRLSARDDVSQDLLAAKLALTESQDENAQVRSATGEVSRRLDGVIERLKAVLEE
jgi:hypothetical protein